MKKIIYSILFICGTILSCIASDFNSNSAINLTRDFINQLTEDKPFTYDDEVKYFGELSLYSAALLTDLGYIDASGKWIKPKPKMSFLCELIRSNRQQFVWEKNDSSFSFAGIPREFNKISYEWPIDGQVVFVQCKENTQNVNVILFYYRIPQQKIDFPIYVNGEALSQKLGFKTVGNKPTLDANKLKLLQKLDTH